MAQPERILPNPTPSPGPHLRDTAMITHPSQPGLRKFSLFLIPRISLVNTFESALALPQPLPC